MTPPPTGRYGGTHTPPMWPSSYSGFAASSQLQSFPTPPRAPQSPPPTLPSSFYFPPTPPHGAPSDSVVFEGVTEVSPAAGDDDEELFSSSSSSSSSSNSLGSRVKVTILSGGEDADLVAIKLVPSVSETVGKLASSIPRSLAATKPCTDIIVHPTCSTKDEDPGPAVAPRADAKMEDVEVGGGGGGEGMMMDISPVVKAVSSPDEPIWGGVLGRTRADASAFHNSFGLD
jgi:hypothetical protein